MIYFAPFRFDEADLTLWRGQESLSLTRKAAHLLTCLLAARGHWVSKSDILAAVWPDTHVHPDNIKVLVREIRLALHDDAGNPRYIRSEAGRGYAFVGETTDRAGDASRGSQVPLFVNRAGELAALVEAFDSVRAGSGRVVLVTGELGIGKTALCDMFLRVARATAVVHTASGECITNPCVVDPLAPWIDAVRACCRTTPALRDELAPDAPAWHARVSAPAHGLPVSPADVVTLVGELPAALAALSARTPLAIVLEDLQWADAATLAAIAEVARDDRTSKCLVIATVSLHGPARDPLPLAALDAMLRQSTSGFVVSLASWTTSQVERYVDARFTPGCLSELTQTLHDIAGGNPAMLAISIDRLLDAGMLREQDQQWSRVETQRKGLLEALRPVVAAQLDRLTQEQRTLLEAASAIGLEWTAADAAMAADAGERDTARLLDLLADRCLVVRRVPDLGSARHPRGAFRFLHPLYLELLAQRAPMTQQIRSARRLAAMAERARQEA